MVAVRDEFDAATSTDTLELTQRTPATPEPEELPLHIPFAVGLLDRDGRDIPLRLPGEAAPVGTTRVLELREARQTFRFAGIARRRRLAAANFSAPIIVHFPTPTRILLPRGTDSDAVTRWDAAQRWLANAMLALARCHCEGRPMGAATHHWCVSSKNLLADRVSDPALIAHGADAARCGIRRRAGARRRSRRRDRRERIPQARDRHALRDLFERVYASVACARPTRRPTTRPVRAGSPTCRALPRRPSTFRRRAIAVAHYHASDNMTDTLAALAALKDGVNDERDGLFARFEARWRDEPLVLDNGLRRGAGRAGTDALTRVQALLAHRRASKRAQPEPRAVAGRRVRAAQFRALSRG